LLRNEKDIGKVYNEGLHIETKAAVTRERLEALRKNWDFDRVLKGRGFSRKCSEISGGFRRWGKLRVSKRLFSQPLGVATIRVMATRGGNGYQLLRRSKQQRGLSDSVRLAPHFAQDDGQISFHQDDRQVRFH
jgi:hypothetical protein